MTLASGLAAHRRLVVEDDLADRGAPGLGADAPWRRTPACASNCGNISCQLLAGDAARASSMVMRPSSTSWPAIRKAASAVRLPTRVCSIHSLPRSIVNSMSHRSR
jgi:hypothetical protein